MAKCSWRFAVLALCVIAASRQSGAASIADPEVMENETVQMKPIESIASEYYTNPSLLALKAVFDQGLKKIVSSFSEVEQAAEGMLKNVETYVTEFGKEFFRDAEEYLPHLKEFYNAIPAKAYHKLVLDSLRTALKQSQDHCGRLALDHNPIHPGLKLDLSRTKRAAERMNLAKFGESLSTWMTSIDTFVVEYLKNSIPVTCPMLERWIKELIAKVEVMKPEEVKKPWN